MSLGRMTSSGRIDAAVLSPAVAWAGDDQQEKQQKTTAGGECQQSGRGSRRANRSEDDHQHHEGPARAAVAPPRGRSAKPQEPGKQSPAHPALRGQSRISPKRSPTQRASSGTVPLPPTHTGPGFLPGSGARQGSTNGVVTPVTLGAGSDQRLPAGSNASPRPTGGVVGIGSLPVVNVGAPELVADGVVGATPKGKGVFPPGDGAEVKTLEKRRESGGFLASEAEVASLSQRRLLKDELKAGTDLTLKTAIGSDAGTSPAIAKRLTTSLATDTSPVTTKHLTANPATSTSSAIAKPLIASTATSTSSAIAKPLIASTVTNSDTGPTADSVICNLGTTFTPTAITAFPPATVAPAPAPSQTTPRNRPTSNSSRKAALNHSNQNQNPILDTATTTLTPTTPTCSSLSPPSTATTLMALSSPDSDTPLHMEEGSPYSQAYYSNTLDPNPADPFNYHHPSQTYLNPALEDKSDNSTPLEDHPHPLPEHQTESRKKPSFAAEALDLTYGWGSFRPECLQFLNKPIWVVFFICMAIVAESMATFGLVSITISTLETRFQLSSNQAGLIPSAYECAGLPALIISGYFGGNGHRPRWIAFGMLLFSLGSLLFTLPHFLTGPYSVDQSTLQTRTDNMCHANQTSSSYDSCTSSNMDSDLSHYLYLFMAGHTLHGIGGVPLYTLSLTYIDDITTRGTASVYIGVILSLTTFGPAIAFVGAGYLLEFYTDLDVVDTTTVALTSSDPRWVGAWWIGFLVTFCLAIITVIPLAGFPRDMPGAAEHRKKRITEVHDNGDSVDIAGVHPGVIKVHDFPRAVSVLARNPTFMFLTLVGAFELFFLAGFGTFEPKYMENMFHVSPSTAGTITGLLGVPGGAAGSIIASVLIKRLKMTSMQMLKWMFILTICIIFLNVIFLVQCDNLPFAGVNVPYPGSTDVISLLDGCNQQCACSEFSYEPVCGSNNIFYFSPCHAGCDIFNATGQYENCACVPSVSSVPSFAQTESCISSCYLLPVYSALFFLGILSAYLTAMFHLLAVIRVVPEEHRSFAVSIDWFMSRLLGGILGPVAFGSILDMTCVLWERKCDGSGSCLYYNNGSMGWYIFSMSTVCLIACLLSSFMAWWKYKPPPPARKDLTGALSISGNHANSKAPPDDRRVTLEMNGMCLVKQFGGS